MLAILSDVHGNLAALKAVLDDAVKKGCTEFISLGDVIGYYSKPNECIDLLRHFNIPHLLGNHDNYIVSGVNCERSKVVAGIIDDHKKMITVGNLEWLNRALPRIELEKCLMLHGGPKDPIDEYVYSISEDMFPDGVDTLFVGHTHVQFMHDFSGKIFCNPGAVGQPRDGDPRAAYVIYENGNINLQRLNYDIEITVSDMKEKGYEPFLYENLYAGTQIGGRIDQIIVSEDN